jgi:hypothetical protein
MMRLPFGKLDHVDLRLDVGPLEVLQTRDLDLVVEVADVADDRHVLHLRICSMRDDVLVAGRVTKMSARGRQRLRW